MTIHKSKGLEFPVVVLADMDRKQQTRLGAISFEKELGPLVKVPKKFGEETKHLGLRDFGKLVNYFFYLYRIDVYPIPNDHIF